MDQTAFSRRAALAAGLSALAAPAAAATAGERLAKAARAQLGVTHHYDPAYVRLAYPGGDISRSTGVCADVIVRAGRDGLGLDLQKLVHEDMARAFEAYPSRRAWGLKRPDRSIDHRRVLNLETYFRRAGARLWTGKAAGYAFPQRLEPGDIVTWVLLGGLQHIGMVAQGGRSARIVHNIARGAEEIPLALMARHQAKAHYRWPAA